MPANCGSSEGLDPPTGTAREIAETQFFYYSAARHNIRTETNACRGSRHLHKLLWMDGKRLGISSPEIHAAPVFHHRIYSTVY
jgi:hypothetical protein